MVKTTTAKAAALGLPLSANPSTVANVLMAATEITTT
jgi:hypothetical protein